MTDAPTPTLLEYLDGLTQHLAAQLSAALLSGEVAAIHQSRVATRRLTAALRLVEPIVSKGKRKRLERSLRKMRKRLGRLRDLDVMMDHLAELRVDHKQPDAIDWLQRQLAVERESAHHQTVDDVPLYKTLGQIETWRMVRVQIEEQRDAVDALIGQSLHQQMDAFAAEADRLVSPDEHRDETRPDPHAVRIAGKSLRYTLEMADAAGHALPTDILKSFKQMQDALGSWHDYVVLTEQIMQRSAEQMLALHDVPLQMEVLQLSMNVLGIAQKHLAKFNQLWQKNGGRIVESIRVHFPLTRDANLPQMDPDPVVTGESSAPQEPPGASTSAA